MTPRANKCQERRVSAAFEPIIGRNSISCPSGSQDDRLDRASSPSISLARPVLGQVRELLTGAMFSACPQPGEHRFAHTRRTLGSFNELQDVPNRIPLNLRIPSAKVQGHIQDERVVLPARSSRNLAEGSATPGPQRLSELPGCHQGAITALSQAPSPSPSQSPYPPATSRSPRPPLSAPRSCSRPCPCRRSR